MKAGVRTTPCAVVISPARAAPSVVTKWKENGLAIAAYLSEQQASVAIGVKAVIARYRMGISALHHVNAAKGADQHIERRPGQTKVSQHGVDGAETITGRH